MLRFRQSACMMIQYTTSTLHCNEIYIIEDVVSNTRVLCISFKLTCRYYSSIVPFICYCVGLSASFIRSYIKVVSICKERNLLRARDKRPFDMIALLKHRNIGHMSGYTGDDLLGKSGQIQTIYCSLWYRLHVT